jgi:hypothetical protein
MRSRTAAASTFVALAVAVVGYSATESQGGRRRAGHKWGLALSYAGRGWRAGAVDDGPMDGQAAAALSGHRLRPGHTIVGTIACSCGRHLTWRCECGAVTYGPALTEQCSLLDGPARVR